jgi:hypothetical protein
MNLRLSTHGFYVDPVLGWAARLEDTEAGAMTEGKARTVRTEAPAKQRAEGDEK